MYPIMSETLPEVIQGIESQLTTAANTIEEADVQISEAFKS